METTGGIMFKLETIGKQGMYITVRVYAKNMPAGDLTITRAQYDFLKALFNLTPHRLDGLATVTQPITTDIWRWIRRRYHTEECCKDMHERDLKCTCGYTRIMEKWRS
jgi:hypothetical protein